MSRVTNIIVTLDILDHQFIIDRLNTWLRLGDHCPLLKVDDYCGGKAFEAHVYMGAFNFFSSERFLAFCKSIEAKYQGKRPSPIHFSVLHIPDEGGHYFTDIGERY